MFYYYAKFVVESDSLSLVVFSFVVAGGERCHRDVSGAHVQRPRQGEGFGAVRKVRHSLLVMRAIE